MCLHWFICTLLIWCIRRTIIKTAKAKANEKAVVKTKCVSAIVIAAYTWLLSCRLSKSCSGKVNPPIPASSEVQSSHMSALHPCPLFYCFDMAFSLDHVLCTPSRALSELTKDELPDVAVYVFIMLLSSFSKCSCVVFLQRFNAKKEREESECVQTLIVSQMSKFGFFNIPTRMTIVPQESKCCKGWQVRSHIWQCGEHCGCVWCSTGCWTHNWWLVRNSFFLLFPLFLIISSAPLSVAGAADSPGQVEEDDGMTVMSPLCQDPLLAQTYLGLPLLPCIYHFVFSIFYFECLLYSCLQSIVWDQIFHWLHRVIVDPVHWDLCKNG